MASKAMAKGMEKLSEENPHIDFTIDEDMIDGILMAGCEKINAPDYIPKMYCEIEGNEYTFYIDLQVSFLKTRAAIYTIGEAGDEDFTFSVTGLKLGRLPIKREWAGALVTKFVSDETINDAFAKANFHIKSDLANLRLVYNRNDFQNDVGNYLSELGGDNKFLDVLLGMFGDKESGILEPSFSDGITARFNLEPLKIAPAGSKHPSKYYKDAPINFQNLEGHRAEVEKLLNSGLPEDKVDEVFTFCLCGKNSNSSVTDYIREISDKELGKQLIEYLNVESFDEYKGSYIDAKRETTFVDYSSKIAIESEDLFKITGNTKVTFTLDSNEINQVLANKLTTESNIIGLTMPITYKDEDGNWRFQYVIIDNAYIGFEESENDTECGMVFYLRFNVGGVPVTVEIASDTIDCSKEDVSIITNFKDMYFGLVEIKDEQYKDSVLSLVPSSTGPLTYDSANIKINLANLSNIEGEVAQKIIAIFENPSVKRSCKKSTEPGTDKLELEFWL
ncbi:MAG: hypothetical protein MJ208_02520, partial [Bacilli bacterium]|nr:hypothetical protein [Bacilli bacterium]